MNTFIHGMGLISAQETFERDSLVKSIDYPGRKFQLIEPDYSEWIDPKSIRRMSKIIRTGVAAAKLALKQSGLKTPDAIITGTGLGCLEDTELFLNKLINNNEEALNPTPFIQSTHNTIGSQVALITQCLGYNQTYTHRAFSFELALQDALLLLEENPTKNVLMGSADELTDLSLAVFEKFGWHVQHGEGAGFFVLNGQRQNAIAEVCGVNMIFKPKHPAAVTDRIEEMLHHAGIKAGSVDLVLSGECGDHRYDSLTEKVLNTLGLFDRRVLFKNLCGEYSTASSFAVWLACTMLKNQSIPETFSIPPKSIRNVLLYNSYFNQHHSLILLKAC